MESFMLVVIISKIALTLATSEGLEQDALSQVKVSTTTYSTCQLFEACNRREDDSSRWAVRSCPQDEVRLAAQVSDPVHANSSMLPKAASVNACRSASESEQNSLLVDMDPGVLIVWTTTDG
jgi:hypothetical protein